jgi:hypothetical protein
MHQDQPSAVHAVGQLCFETVLPENEPATRRIIDDARFVAAHWVSFRSIHSKASVTGVIAKSDEDLATTYPAARARRDEHLAGRETAPAFSAEGRSAATTPM